MPNSLVRKLEDYVQVRKSELIESLQSFLRMKSISAQAIGMEETALYLQETMDKIGIQTEMWNIEGAFPVVYGEILNPDARKTLLIYGHYDVQPPEPLELWDHDPFDPVIKDGKIMARGATDDKGNLWATIMAVKSLRDNGIPLPINLKFFFEGEEEVGSPHFKSYMEKYKEVLAADYTILCDRGIHESGRPQMYLGHKGIMSVEVKIKGAKRDVHSGQAPLIPNAAWELVWMLNQLKNDQDEILLPGYYDEVLPPSQVDLDLLEKVPFDKEEYCRIYEIDDILPGTDGAQALYHLLFRPTATINGLTSGYQGVGNKTIIPNEARVKLDFRFVKNQDPVECAKKINTFFEQHARGRVEVTLGDVRNPSKVTPEAEIVQVAMGASKDVYGTDPVVWPMLDGAGPMALFGEILDAPAIIIGLGAPFAFANTHAPNEYIGVDDYLNGIKLMATIYYRYGNEGIE